MTKKKIYLAWLSTGKREDIHIYLLRDLQKRYGDKVELVLPDQCCWRTFHDAARNAAVDNFLASDCDVLWFLDSDVCPPAHILELVTNEWDKWQVAGAPYPIFMPVPGREEHSILFTAYKGVLNDPDQPGIYMADVPQSGAEMVDALATGCLFIKREVFAKLEKPYFEFKFDHESRRIKEGEDLGFALKLSRLGIQFYCDYGMVCKHYKTLDLLDMNNYAIEMANYKVQEYHKSAMADVGQVIAAAKEKYFRDGFAAGVEAAKGPQRSKAGLILPQSLNTR